MKDRREKLMMILSDVRMIPTVTDESAADAIEKLFPVSEWKSWPLPEIGEKVLCDIVPEGDSSEGEGTILLGRLMDNGWSIFWADGERLMVGTKVRRWQAISPPKI